MEMIIDQLRKISNATWHPETYSLEKNIFHICDKMYIGIVDHPDKKPAHGVEWLSNWFNNNNRSSKITDPEPVSKVEVVVYPDNKEEADTLKWIRDYAKDNPGDYVLYFHMKGITKQNAATEDWRKYMEYFVIERWKDCIAKLDEGYDCCGVMWNSHTPIGEWPHFSGNFWWANTSYINTLNHEYLELTWRYYREFWIGSNPNVNQYEFHNSRMNDRHSLEAHKGHYDVVYPREKYAL